MPISVELPEKEIEIEKDTQEIMEHLRKAFSEQNVDNYAVKETSATEEQSLRIVFSKIANFVLSENVFFCGKKILIPACLIDLDTPAYVLYEHYRDYLNKLIMDLDGKECDAEGTVLKGKFIVLREILLRLTLMTLKVKIDDIDYGDKMIKIIRKFVAELNRSSVLYTGGSVISSNDSLSHANIQLLTDHDDWIEMMTEMVNVLKVIHAKDTSTSAVLSYLKSNKLAIVRRILVFAGYPLKENSLSENWLMTNFNLFEKMMLSKVKLSTTALVEFKQTATISWGRSNASELSNYLLQGIADKLKQEKLSKSKREETLEKIKKLYQLFYKSNLLFLATQNVESLIQIGGWAPILTGFLNMSSLAGLVGEHHTESQELLRLTPEELVREANNKAYLELIKYNPLHFTNIERMISNLKVLSFPHIRHQLLEIISGSIRQIQVIDRQLYTLRDGKNHCPLIDTKKLPLQQGSIALLCQQEVGEEFAVLTADECFKEGERYLDQKMPQEAERFFSRAIEISKSASNEINAKYYYHLGLSYYRQEKYKAAITQFEAAKKLNYCSEYFNEIGWAYYSLEDYEEAYKYYLQAHNLNKDKPHYKYNVGLALWKMVINGDSQSEDYLEEAKNFINDAINNYHRAGKAKCNYRLGKIYFRKKQYKEAQDVFSKAIKLDEQSARYHYHEGRAWYMLKKLDEAEKSFTQAIVNGEKPIYRSHLGKVLYKQKKYRLAIKEFEKAKIDFESLADKIESNRIKKRKKVFNRMASNSYYLGKAYLQERDYDKAEVFLADAIKQGAEDAVEIKASYYFTQGALFQTQKKYENARKSYHQAIKLQKSAKNENLKRLAKYHHRIAWTHYRERNNYAAAAENYQKASELQPDCDKYHLHAGYAFWKAQQLDLAKDCFTKVYDKCNGNASKALCVYRLGKIHLMKQNYREAATAFSLAISLKPNYCNYYRQGIAHYGLGEYSLAKEAFVKAKEVFTNLGDREKDRHRANNSIIENDPIYYEVLAEVYLISKTHTLANENYKKAAELYFKCVLRLTEYEDGARVTAELKKLYNFIEKKLLRKDSSEAHSLAIELFYQFGNKLLRVMLHEYATDNDSGRFDKNVDFYKQVKDFSQKAEELYKESTEKSKFDTLRQEYVQIRNNIGQVLNPNLTVNRTPATTGNTSQVEICNRIGTFPLRPSVPISNERTSLSPAKQLGGGGKQ